MLARIRIALGNFRCDFDQPAVLQFADGCCRGFRQLNQLRQTVQEDPETLRQVQDLIKEMQRLDPSRFPGNPALVEQLHTQVLSDVDKLELQLRRKADDSDAGQIRSTAPLPVPSGYQQSVAEYFRRLSDLNKKTP